jgi:hypothetical protein
MDIKVDRGSELKKLISYTFPIDWLRKAWETPVAGVCATVMLKLSAKFRLDSTSEILARVETCERPRAANYATV